MPRRVARRYHHFAKCKSIAIFYFLRSKTVFCPAFSTGVNLRRFESRAELARATHEVGMNMRFKNMRDGHPSFTRRVDINIAVRAWIKNRGDSFIIVADR